MRPGDYGLTNIQGPLGFMVGLGQLMLDDASRFTHALIVVNDEIGIEARPAGAGYVDLSLYEGRIVYSNMELTDLQRLEIVRAASSLVGRGYNWLDYLALGLRHKGVNLKYLNDRIANTDRLICSQLVDEAYRKAGVHLFDDGRLPQDVTPGDLFYRAYDVPDLGA